MVFVAEDGAEQTITWSELDTAPTSWPVSSPDRGSGWATAWRCACATRPSTCWPVSPAGRWGRRWSRCAGTSPTGSGTGCWPCSSPDLVVDADHARPVRREPVVRRPRPARSDRAPRVGGVQLGVDRNAQGHRAEGPGRLPASTNVTSSVVASYGPMSRPQRVLCPAPLYHTNGFTAFRTLLDGDPIVLMERFKAPLVLDLIETPPDHRVHRRHPHAAAAGPGPRHRGARPVQPELGPTGGGAAPAVAGPLLDRPGRGRALLHVLRRLRE